MKLHPDQTLLSDKIQVKVNYRKKSPNVGATWNQQDLGKNKRKKKEKIKKRDRNWGHYIDQSRSPCINVV